MNTIADCKSGEIIKWSGYDWIVIDDGLDDKRILLMNDLLENRAFDSKENYSNDWRSSTVRKYLNSEFYDKLEGKRYLVDYESDLTADNGNTDYGTSIDKVFLISCDFYLRNKKDITLLGDWWWTITPYYSYGNGPNIRIVLSSGMLSYHAAYRCHPGIRPAVCVSSDILI